MVPVSLSFFRRKSLFGLKLIGRNDLIWSNPHPHPRWGQGAFRTSLEALYTSLTKDPLPMNITQFGKPSTATFNYAENVLMDYLDQWHGVNQLNVDGTRAAPRRVYMFGDSPDSGITYVEIADVDIRGANEFGWYSILVRTGNFKGEGNSAEFPAKRVFDDVEKAVDWIVGHEDRRYFNLLKAQEQGLTIDEQDEGYYTD
jgi:ribonucleotide monophosphatase NagD (HAD superfamily)